MSREIKKGSRPCGLPKEVASPPLRQVKQAFGRRAVVSPLAGHYGTATKSTLLSSKFQRSLALSRETLIKHEHFHGKYIGLVILLETMGEFGSYQGLFSPHNLDRVLAQCGAKTDSGSEIHYSTTAGIGPVGTGACASVLSCVHAHTNPRRCIRGYHCNAVPQKILGMHTTKLVARLGQRRRTRRVLIEDVIRISTDGNGGRA